MIKTLLLVLAGWVLSVDSYAQGQVAQDCRDRNPTAAYECSYSPQIVEDFRYQVAGPIRASKLYKTEDPAWDEWKGYVFTGALCSGPFLADVSPWTAETYWRPNLLKTRGVSHSYVYSVRYSDGTCSTSLTATGYMSVRRNIICAAGWVAQYDTAENVDYCRRPVRPSCEIEAGNPVAIPSGDKVQRDTDYRSPANPLLIWSRTYRSSGRATLANTYADQWVAAGYGNFWSHNLDRILSVPSSGGVIWMRRGDGVTTYFANPTSYPTVLSPTNAGEVGILNVLSPVEQLYVSADNTIEHYVYGRLVNVTSTAGLSISIAYNGSAGQISAVTDSFGRVLNFSSDSAGKLTSMTLPDGGVISYSYTQAPKQPEDSGYIGNEYNYLSQVTYQDGKFRAMKYDPVDIAGGVVLPYRLNGITDENGVDYSKFVYDSQGYALSTELAGGVNKWTRSSTGFLDPLGNSAGNSNYVSVLGRMHLSSQYQPAGSGCSEKIKYATYDANGNAASRDDFNGVRTCYANDLNRNLETSRVEGLPSSAACSTYTPANAALATGSRKISTAWHPDWRLETSVAEPGRITMSVYNGQPDPFNGNAIASCAPTTALLPGGKPIAVVCKQVQRATTDTDGHLGFSAALQGGVANRVQNWTYNQHGQVLTAKDALNNTTTYSYYSDTSFSGADPNAVGHTIGDLQTVTNAAGQVTTYSLYDKHGQLLRSVDPNGVTTDNTYDKRMRLTSSTVGGLQTNYTYDAAGLLTQLSLPDTTTVTYAYDPAHRLTKVTDQAGNSVTYTLDNAGNRTQDQTMDPSGNLARVITRAFDALGRMKQVTGTVQ